MKDQEEILEAFKNGMRWELLMNESKGDWRDFTDKDKILSEIDYHYTKLKGSVDWDNKKLIKEHIGDCANLLMMLGNSYDLY